MSLAQKTVRADAFCSRKNEVFSQFSYKRELPTAAKPAVFEALIF